MLLCTKDDTNMYASQFRNFFKQGGMKPKDLFGVRSTWIKKNHKATINLDFKKTFYNQSKFEPLMPKKSWFKCYTHQQNFKPHTTVILNFLLMA